MTQLTRRHFLTVTATACAGLAIPQMAFAEGGTLDDIRKRGKLVIGTEAAYEPFEFVKDGKIVGYGRDILELMAAKLGVKLEQLNVPFQGLLPGLMARKFDFVATSVGINEERAKRFAFSAPVGVVASMLMVRASDSAINGPDDLAGKNVGTQMGSSSQPVVEGFGTDLKTRTGKTFEIKLFQSYPDTYVALANKSIDVAVIPSNVASVTMRNTPNAYKLIGRIGQPKLLSWVANPKDLEIRAFINSFLDELRKSGKLDELQKKWFGTPMVLPTSSYLPAGAI